MSNYTKIGTVDVSVDTERNVIEFHTQGDAKIWLNPPHNGVIDMLVDQLLTERYYAPSLHRTMEKFKDPKAIKEQLHQNPLTYAVVRTLSDGASPFHLISDLLAIIENQRKDIERFLIASPQPHEQLFRLNQKQS